MCASIVMDNQEYGEIASMKDHEDRIMKESLTKMVICATHIGTKNIEHKMMKYVYKKNQSGAHIIDLTSTWEKIKLAAKVIVAIENPLDVIAVSARSYGTRAILKFSELTGTYAFAGRWTPGVLTNQTTKKYMEPRLLIVLDPRQDQQAIIEASYANIPVISLCNTDSPLENIDIAIPCNNRGRESIGLIYWLLTRQILYLRQELRWDEEWNIPVDYFFWRNPDAEEKEEKEEEEKTPIAEPHLEASVDNEWAQDLEDVDTLAYSQTQDRWQNE